MLRVGGSKTFSPSMAEALTSVERAGYRPAPSEEALTQRDFLCWSHFSRTLSGGVAYYQAMKIFNVSLAPPIRYLWFSATAVNSLIPLHTCYCN